MLILEMLKMLLLTSFTIEEASTFLQGVTGLDPGWLLHEFGKALEHVLRRVRCEVLDQVAVNGEVRAKMEKLRALVPGTGTHRRLPSDPSYHAGGQCEAQRGELPLVVGQHRHLWEGGGHRGPEAEQWPCGLSGHR